MARTRFKTGDRKDIFLYNTTVENLFINEFLPEAPGECVKVFLFGLMYAQYNEEIDSRTLALTLGMNERDVDNAWKYWEAQGLVRLYPDAETDFMGVEFVRQIDLFYGKTLEETQEPEEGTDAIIANVVNQQLKELFDKYQRLTGRTMSRHEAGKFTDAIKVYNIEPDVLDFAIDYCVELEKYSVDYIFKVALRWTEEGCRDVASVKVMLDKHSRRYDFYRKVFGSLGFTRLPSPADREMMDRWVDDWGFSAKDVLEGCKAAAGLREPNLKYVNKVLENKMLEKGGIDTRKSSGENRQPAYRSAGRSGSEDTGNNGQVRVSQRVLREYYDYLREEEEKTRLLRIDEVSNRIPEMKTALAAIAELNREVVTLLPGPDGRQKRQQLKEKRRELEDEKRELLIRSGYPEDYLERKYRCAKCKDTGYTDEGRVCTCCRERADEAYRWIQETKNH